MKRENISRTENGKMEKRLDGLDEFGKEVAEKLLKEYPTVDFFDLLYQFESSFRYEYSRAMARETIQD